MSPDGRLTFLHKPWWPRAQKLREGESFTLDLNHDGRPDTVILRRGDNIIEAIDDTGRAVDILNRADTAYVVSYHRTGIVDRMVVYIDNNQDGKADEMEIRYYRDGYLRYAWFGENYDNDGTQIFHLTNWEYDGKQFQSKFRGNVMIYLNKYDPATQSWVPLSECPFAFWDPNHEGLAEIALRVSAAPLQSQAGKDMDYANHYDHLWTPKAVGLHEIGNLNVRLSYNIDPEPRREPWTQPHFNFGFTLVGAEPYDYPDMLYTNPRRRPPQAVVRIPWNNALQMAADYHARQTGFSWDEAHSVDRWEGQFWIGERELLYNTGDPTVRWNIRREYSGAPAAQRELYYSDVDKRYHLFGASESWLEVGHLVNARRDLEIRAFDNNHDGFLDTWEVFKGDSPHPVRRTYVRDPKTRKVPLDPARLGAEYNNKILPEAIEEDEELIAALRGFATDPLAEAYERAAKSAAPAERRRYCLDVARELYFLQARDVLYARNAAGSYPGLGTAAPGEAALSLRLGPIKGGYTLGDTLSYWKLAKEIEAFVEDYSQGRVTQSIEDLQRIRSDVGPSPARRQPSRTNPSR